MSPVHPYLSYSAHGQNAILFADFSWGNEKPRTTVSILADGLGGAGQAGSQQIGGHQYRKRPQ